MPATAPSSTETGYNIALFKVEDAEPINRASHEVTGAEVRYNEIANSWFSIKRGSERRNLSEFQGCKDFPLGVTG